jgi:hypothetical protein
MSEFSQSKPLDAIPGVTVVRPTRLSVLRHSMAWMLAALVVLFVATPFIQELPNAQIVEALLVTAVLTAAVLAVGGGRKHLVIAIALAGPAGAARWAHHLFALEGARKFFIVAFLLFTGFVVFQFLRFILRAPRVNSEVLCTAASTYLLIALVWASAYSLVARLNPAAFTGLPTGTAHFQEFATLYFSLTTLTTVGYGDIVPVSNPARMLAMLEAVTGTMYVAMLISRLVSIYSASHHPDEMDKSGPPQ